MRWDETDGSVSVFAILRTTLTDIPSIRRGD
jgi:hypothetical protein